MMPRCTEVRYNFFWEFWIRANFGDHPRLALPRGGNLIESSGEGSHEIWAHARTRTDAAGHEPPPPPPGPLNRIASGGHGGGWILTERPSCSSETWATPGSPRSPRLCPGAQGIDQVDCPGDLPDNPIRPEPPPSLDRRAPASADRRRPPPPARIGASRRQASRFGDGRDPPAVFLCVSPFVRYDDLHACSGLVDLVVSEAEAADVLPRRVSRLLGTAADRSPGNDVPSLRIEVAGGNAELCDAVAEACTAAGYNARRADDLPREDWVLPRDDRALPGDDPAAGADRVLTIWEVPVLEPDWSERLARRALLAGPVIALIGFADRTTVTQAKPPGPSPVSICLRASMTCSM